MTISISNARLTRRFIQSFDPLQIFRIELNQYSVDAGNRLGGATTKTTFWGPEILSAHHENTRRRYSASLRP